MQRFLPLTLLWLSACFVRAQDGYSDPGSSSYGSVSIETFGPSLDPYGAWFVLPGYGRAWQPSMQYVGADFYPYGTGGRWVYTNAGWVFDSDYPFGWAVFHYGRWYRDFSYGWLWLPGRTWAPSWVSWRAGGPYIGWAPLGPRGAPGYDSWCFVPTHRFTVGYPRRYSLGAREFHRAVAVTTPVQPRSRVPVGPPPRYVSSATRQRIVPVPLSQVPSAAPSPPRQGRRFGAPPPPNGQLQPERRQGERFSTPPPPRQQEPQTQPGPMPQPERRSQPSLPPPPSGGRFRSAPPWSAPPSAAPSQPSQRPSSRSRSVSPPPPARSRPGGPTLAPPPPPPPR